LDTQIKPTIVETTTSSGGTLQLLLLLSFLIPAIFFLIAQQKALAVVHPENRRMRPGLVWLQLIPLFNYFWAFVVVRRIADSFAKQYAAYQNDSILGVVDEEALKVVGKRPTYAVGLAYCILLPCLVLFNVLFNVFFPEITRTDLIYASFGGIMFFLALAIMICWVIYWVQLARFKNKLKRGTA
jgi:hypothetical protein